MSNDGLTLLLLLFAGPPFRPVSPRFAPFRRRATEVSKGRRATARRQRPGCFTAKVVGRGAGTPGLG